MMLRQAKFDAVYWSVAIGAWFLIIVFCLTGCASERSKMTIVQPDRPAMCADKSAQVVRIAPCDPGAADPR